MICVIGLSHTTAALETREQFFFDDADTVGLLHEILEMEHVEEAVFISTCNRSEVYLSVRKGELEDLRVRIVDCLQARSTASEDAGDSFYAYRHSHAVQHLLRVAAGLDSMVLGENQVLGQLKNAYRLSATRGMTGRVLDRLFHKAFENGKRVRTETNLNKGASSVSSKAVELAETSFDTLENKRVLLIGAGETGSLALQSLVDRGCRSIDVSNRDSDKGRAVADLHGVGTCPFEECVQRLYEYDIFLVSTSSPEPVLSAEAITGLASPEGKKRLILDLSVPRNVELPPELPEQVLVYNVDDLSSMAGHAREMRRHEAERAEEIVRSQRDEFLSWLSSLELSPTIRSLTEKSRSLYEKDLASLKKKLSEEEYCRVEEFTKYYEGRLLGLVIRNLRRLTEGGKHLAYIEMMHELFELDGRKNDEP